MKTKVIGQCKDCKWFLLNDDIGYAFEGTCRVVTYKDAISDTSRVDKAFGCWYWKAKL